MPVVVNFVGNGQNNGDRSQRVNCASLSEALNWKLEVDINTRLPIPHCIMGITVGKQAQGDH